MPSTPVYALPYPAAADPADVPLDMQELADRLETLKVRSGAEMAYNQITVPVTGTATDPAATDLVIAGTTLTYDGGPVIAEFSTPLVQHSVAGTFVWIALFDGSTMLGRMVGVHAPVAGGGGPAQGRMKVTPSAGSHTFSARVYSSAAGTATIWAHPGGVNVYVPAFLRIVQGS